MRLLVSVVACAVPLRGDLTVETPNVVVYGAVALDHNLVMKGLASEEGRFFLGGKWPVKGDTVVE